MNDTSPDTGLYLMLGEMRGQLSAIKEDTSALVTKLGLVAGRVTALENAQLVSQTRIGILATVWGAMGGSLITVALRKLGVL
jgi:hypothetical protein